MRFHALDSRAASTGRVTEPSRLLAGALRGGPLDNGDDVLVLSFELILVQAQYSPCRFVQAIELPTVVGEAVADDLRRGSWGLGPNPGKWTRLVPGWEHSGCCCKLAFSTKTADPVPALCCTLTNS